MTTAFRWLFACALIGLLPACYTPKSGRTWKRLDSHMERLESSVGLAAKDLEDQEIHAEASCLVIRQRASAFESFESIQIYEAEDWTESDLGVRKVEKFLISDPPGRNFPGVTERVPPSAVPDSVRRPSGLQVEELPASTYPVRVEWQIVADDGRKWIDDPQDLNLVLSDGRDVRSDAGKNFEIYLCDVELRKMLSVPVPELALLFRVSPLEWPSGSRGAKVKVLYARERITRAMIEACLK